MCGDLASRRCDGIIKSFVKASPAAHERHAGSLCSGKDALKIVFHEQRRPDAQPWPWSDHYIEQIVARASPAVCLLARDHLLELSEQVCLSRLHHFQIAMVVPSRPNSVCGLNTCG